MINSYNANSGICGLNAQGKVDSAKLIGQIDTAQLATDAVNGDKIDDDAVDSEHIVGGAVDYDHISFGSTATDLGGSTPANNVVPTQAATKSYVDSALGNIDVSSSIEDFATNEWEGIMIKGGVQYGIQGTSGASGTITWGRSDYAQTQTYQQSMYHHPLSGDLPNAFDTDPIFFSGETIHYGATRYLCQFYYADPVSNRWTTLAIANRQTRDAILEISGVLGFQLRTSGNSHQNLRCAIKLDGTTVKTLSLPSNFNQNTDQYEMPYCYAGKITNMGTVKLKFDIYHTASASYYTHTTLRSCVVKVTYI